MTSLNVAHSCAMASALYRTAVDTFDEFKDAPRQLALLHSISLIINRMQGVEHIDHLVTWACELLAMLEDCCSAACPDGDEKAAQAIYQAISRVQAALGVPEDGRAWLFSEPEPEDVRRLHDARPYAIQAAALFPIMQPLLEAELSRHPVQLLKAKAAMCGGVQALRAAGSADTLSDVVGYVSLAQGMNGQALGCIPPGTMADTSPVWGLFAGVYALLGDAARCAEGAPGAKAIAI